MAAPDVTVSGVYLSQQGVPGQEVLHRYLTVRNDGTADDRFNVTLMSSNSWELQLRNDSGRVIGEDSTGDGVWESVSDDSNQDGLPDTGLLAPGESRTFSVAVLIPVGASPGTVETTMFAATSVTSPNPLDSLGVQTSVLSSDSPECNCGYGDGVMVSYTGAAISTDGALNPGWSAVFADLDNNICDGGQDADRIYQPQPDLDFPVQSTGRDLIHFAFTWNASHVLTYTGRAASATNTQNFVYYADTDNDGMMETGERVIAVGWKGTNRTVEISLGSYNAVDDTNGDPMVDPVSGLGDGYTLPGKIDGLPNQPDYSGAWGLEGGVAMHWEVSWADLGIPPGTAFTFHVTAVNSQPDAQSYPAQVDDNMGGCGGGPGTSQFAGIDFVADETADAAPQTTICLPHVITNTGNGTDSFTFTHSTAGDFSLDAIVVFQDLGTLGELDAADVNLSSSGTGDLDPGELMNLLICYTLGTDDIGDVTVITTASSAHDINTTSTVVDSIGSRADPSFTILKSVRVENGTLTDSDDFYVPGSTVLYQVLITNSGLGSPDDASFVLRDDLPDEMVLYVGDYVGGNGGPVRIIEGSPASGLAYTYLGAGDGSDSIVFMDSTGSEIVPDTSGDGFDAGVRSFEITTPGTFAPWSGSGAQPSVTLEYRARIR